MTDLDRDFADYALTNAVVQQHLKKPHTHRARVACHLILRHQAINNIYLFSR